MAGTGAKRLLGQLEKALKNMDYYCNLSGARNLIRKDHMDGMQDLLRLVSKASIPPDTIKNYLLNLEVNIKKGKKLEDAYDGALHEWQVTINYAREIFKNAEAWLDKLSGTETKPRIFKIMALFGKLGAAIETNQKAQKKMTSLLASE